jgi:V/A-type H+-transporting ATPase subunit K
LKTKMIVIIIMALMVLSVSFAFAEEEDSNEGSTEQYIFIKWIAAAFAIGCSTIAGGVAVGQIGAAAMAAMSENPEIGARALPYAALAEGICLWGLGGAVIILIV